MKKLIFVAVLLGGIANAAQFVINPRNVAESCVNHARTLVRDHRVTPMVTYYRYTAAMKACPNDGVGSRLIIKYAGGGDYNGNAGYVTIRSVDLNRCLTNPATYTGAGVDTGELRWENCSNLGETGSRQSFYVQRNQYGATRVVSQLQYALQVPNAVSECMERNNPTNVYRTPCGNLNNWQIRKVVN